MGKENVRHSARKPRLAARDPARDLLGIALLRLLLFEARLVGIRERVDVELFAPLIFDDEVVLPRLHGADGTGASEREVPAPAPEEVDAVFLGNGCGRCETDAVVVVPGNDDDRPLLPRQFLDGTEEDLLRLCGRQVGIEHVPRDEHDGDVLLLCDFGKFAEGVDLFGEAVPVHEPLPDMPIRCMENVHPENASFSPAKTPRNVRQRALLLQARYDILLYNRKPKKASG